MNHFLIKDGNVTLELQAGQFPAKKALDPRLMAKGADKRFLIFRQQGPIRCFVIGHNDRRLAQQAFNEAVK